MLNIFRLLLLMGALLVTTAIYATPSAVIWQRESLIGSNAKYFYTFILERNNPATYFEYTETFSLAQYEIANSKLVNTTVIRKTHYVDKQADGNWVKEEQLTNAFDLNQFLSKANLGYAFPADISETQWLVQADGIYLQGDKGKAILVPKAELAAKVAWFNAYSRIAGLYEINNYYYVLLESGDELGGRSLENDFQQTIIVVTGDSYNQSWQLLNQGLTQKLASDQNPWQVQVGCFRTLSSTEQLVKQLTKAEFKAQIIFSKSSNCHRVILIPRQATQEAAKQQAQQLQEKLNIKGYIGKVEE
jgi:hypothetical protein